MWSAAFPVAADLLAVTACTSGDTAGGSDESRVTVSITESDGHMEPAGETVRVDRDALIKLEVRSDVADEMHVHSVPKHEYEVEAGTPMTFRFRIDTRTPTRSSPMV